MVSKQPRVLVADDSEDSLIIFAELLSFYGFQVAEAADGREALESARQQRPDIIVLDLSMPVLSGWEAARQLRADPELRDVPLVAVTAHAYPTVIDQANEAGFDLVITKPCEPAELRRQLYEVLNRSPEQRDEPVAVSSEAAGPSRR